MEIPKGKENCWSFPILSVEMSFIKYLNVIVGEEKEFLQSSKWTEIKLG